MVIMEHMNEQITLMSVPEPSDQPLSQWRLDDHTRELGRKGVQNVRSILQNTRLDEGHDGHVSTDDVADPKAA